MGDPPSRDHPVDGAGVDRLVRAEAVAMLDFAAKEIGDGRKPDVGVRTHVDSLPRQELRRPHFVEEDERSDHPSPRRRQRATDLKAAEVARARDDHGLDGVEAGLGSRSGLAVMGGLFGSDLKARSLSRSAGDPCSALSRCMSARSRCGVRVRAGRRIARRRLDFDLGRVWIRPWKGIDTDSILEHFRIPRNKSAETLLGWLLWQQNCVYLMS